MVHFVLFVLAALTLFSPAESCTFSMSHTHGSWFRILSFNNSKLSGLYNQHAQQVVQSDDGSLYVSGFVRNALSLLNMNDPGDISWALELLQSEDTLYQNDGKGLVLTDNSEVIVFGHARPTESDDRTGVLMVALDSNGQVLASNHIRWANYSYTAPIFATYSPSDDTILSLDAHDQDIYFLTKMDTTADVLWTKSIPAAGHMITTSDGHIAMVGDSVVSLLTSDGTLVWSKRLEFSYFNDSGNYISSIESIAQFTNNSFVITGQAQIENEDAFFVAKLDEIGSLVWLTVAEENFHDSGQKGTRIIASSENTITVVGMQSSRDAFVCRLNATGDILWLRAFDDTTLTSLSETQDGLWYVAVGSYAWDNQVIFKISRGGSVAYEKLSDGIVHVCGILYPCLDVIHVSGVEVVDNDAFALAETTVTVTPYAIEPKNMSYMVTESCEPSVAPTNAPTQTWTTSERPNTTEDSNLSSRHGLNFLLLVFTVLCCVLL